MLVVDITDSNLELGLPDIGGGPTYLYNGNPFTGKLIAYHNGALNYEMEVIDSHQHGHYISYFSNGQVKSDYYQKYNWFYGIYKRYNEQGILTNYREYDDEGLKLEEKVFDDQGQLTAHELNGVRIL